MPGIISALIAAIAIGIGLGYISGRYVERRAWNELIERRIIPRPRKG